MIIFELDGTLADCEHRRHFIKEPPIWEPNKSAFDPMSCNVNCEKWRNWKPDWKAFYEACDQDKPIKPLIDIFRLISMQYDMVEIWSGRFESVRYRTIEWFTKYMKAGIDEEEYYDSILKMRPIGDYTPDHELKEKWLDEALAEGKAIDFVFDDRKKVCNMWQRRKIFVFNCNQTGEEF